MEVEKAHDYACVPALGGQFFLALNRPPIRRPPRSVAKEITAQFSHSGLSLLGRKRLT
jgi:hypothetical protein